MTYLAHCVLCHLREWVAKKEDRKEIDDVFNDVIMAALLHDVNHGPFSHLFERAFDGAPTHEDWTAHLISNQNSEIHQRLKDSGINVANVASVFDKSETPESSGLSRPYRQIVSSQLDVDRMDYLIRDSHFAGVAIGPFDAHYLIDSIVIVKHGEDSTSSLGITPNPAKPEPNRLPIMMP